MADAKAAADALVSEGVSWVMVFGSVARGQATEHSDIDLIAVYDDMDYSGRERYRLRERLHAVAEAATGHDCGVVVTDRPEWRTRVANVSSSFEHAISKEAITLADTGPGPYVDWHKTQVKPMNNQQQGLEYLNNSVIPKLDELSTCMFATSFDEALAHTSADRERSRLDRMRKICEHSSMTVELLVKALVVFAGEHPVSDKQLKAAGHNIGEGVKQLPEHLRAPMRRAITQFGLSPSVLSTWRVAGTYPDDIDTERDIADERAEDYARTALSVAFSVLDEVDRQIGQPHETVNKIRWKVERMSSLLQKRDIRYDRPLNEPDPSKAPTAGL